MRWFDPEKTPTVGQTPDYRFSLANERTFLAWIRTGLALIAACGGDRPCRAAGPSSRPPSSPPPARVLGGLVVML